jgi:hypothetical protein
MTYFDSLIKELNNKIEIDETAIYNSNSFEVLVKEGSFSSYMGISRDLSEGIERRDDGNKILYRLGYPSDEYLSFLLYKLSRIDNKRGAVARRVIHRKHVEEKDEDNLFNIIRLTFPRVFTLHIRSDDGKSVEEFKKFADAFLFQLSYNLDYSLVYQRFLDEIIRGRGIRRMRRTDIDEIDIPKRFYIPELLYHYQMAIASDSPQLEYLSYYHIAEYFFESVFNEDLIQNVKDLMTQPEFSYNRNKDIKMLIKKISDAYRSRENNVMLINEQEALTLTLKKFVDINKLLEKIIDYNKDLIQYYKTNEVTFSEGICVDLENADKALVYKWIAGRIYKTRNSIVHSKGGEKRRYMPFQDDKLLVNEVPLLRFVAELIIINSSEII